MIWLIPIVVGLLALDGASRTYCVTCYRPFAIWAVKGELRRWLPVCRRCYRVHHARRRAQAAR